MFNLTDLFIWLNVFGVTLTTGLASIKFDLIFIPFIRLLYKFDWISLDLFRFARIKFDLTFDHILTIFYQTILFILLI